MEIFLEIYWETNLEICQERHSERYSEIFCPVIGQAGKSRGEGLRSMGRVFPEYEVGIGDTHILVRSHKNVKIKEWFCWKLSLSPVTHISGAIQSTLKWQGYRCVLGMMECGLFIEILKVILLNKKIKKRNFFKTCLNGADSFVFLEWRSGGVLCGQG